MSIGKLHMLISVNCNRYSIKIFINNPIGKPMINRCLIDDLAASNIKVIIVFIYHIIQNNILILSLAKINNDAVNADVASKIMNINSND
jgi:hypothetical protein